MVSPPCGTASRRLVHSYSAPNCRATFLHPFLRPSCQARRSTFARRLAEAHGRAGQLAAAEAAWRRLADAAEAALMAASCGGEGDSAGAVAAAEAELLDCLTHLADVQVP